MKLNVISSHKNERFSDDESASESQTSFDSPRSESLNDPVSVALRQQVHTIRMERKAILRRLEEIDARIGMLGKKFDVGRGQ